MDLKKCIEFTKEKHKGQKRKQGTPYYTHPIAVCNMLKEKGFEEDYQVAGLFHDLLEDTDCTEQEILELSNERVLEAVKLVTKSKDYVMSEYIKNIAKNNIARMVKLADRIHNVSELKETSQSFQIRYMKETEEWFVELAKGTVFEEDLKIVMEKIQKLL